MKKCVMLIAGVLFCLSASFAQKDIKIANVDVDVSMINDGEGRYYCFDNETKEPFDGKLRIIEGYQSQYVDAEFEKGYATGTWKSFSNNKLAMEADYKDGYPDGEVKKYHSNGKLASLSRYKLGKYDGKWFTYFNDGEIECEKEFKDGELDGLYITFHSNGKKDREKVYKAGKEDGIDRKYDEEGNLRIDDMYKDGKQVGKSIHHNYSNIGDYVCTAYYKDGVLDGDFSEIFEEGGIKSKGKYVDGRKHGRWDYEKSNGDKTLSEEYDKGETIRKITYFTDGSVETDRQMKNGKNHGVVKKYEYEGGLKSEEHYNNGKEDGLQIKYMKSNVADYIVKSNYTNGKRNGAYSEEYKGGETKVKGTYVNDKKHGEWIYNEMELTDKGKLKKKKERKETYDNGRLISK